jgi:hypothetical protein
MRDQGVGGKIILEGMLEEIECDDVDWINLALGMDQWAAVMNTVMNL